MGEEEEEEGLVGLNNHGNPTSYDGLQESNDTDPMSSTETEPTFWRWKIVYIVGWISFIFLIILGIVSMALGKLDNSAAVFAFGFSALIDGTCSGVVVWQSYQIRNHGNNHTSELEAEFLLGIMFIAASIIILVNSIIGFYTPFQRANAVLLIVSGTGGCAEIIFCVFNIYLGKVLQSTSVLANGINSLVCGLLGLSVIPIEFIGFKTNKGSVDHFLGVVVGSFMVIYGFVLLFLVFSKNTSQMWINRQLRRVCLKWSSSSDS